MTQPAPVPTPPPGEPAPVPTPPTTPPTAPPANPAPADDQPLGPAGQKALAAEREARKELEKKLAALSPLQQLADAIGAGQPKPDGKSEVDLLNDRFATYESQLAEERQARWRAEVAAAKGLNADQAAWISGATAEEFAASADKLLASFPSGPRNPAPDPSQGARGPGGAVDLAAKIAEAKSKGDWRTAAALEKSKLANIKR